MLLKCFLAKLILSSTSVSNYAISTGFWGGLVPENALNASALEALLSAGVLGLKVSTYIMSDFNDFLDM